jgi:rRNA-processing protein EBP2
MAGQKITAKISGLKSMVNDSKGTLKGIGNLSAPNESDASEEECEDGENDGVDEEGLEKLMNALGEDGLDEFDLTQLRMLTGSAADEVNDSEEEGRSSDDENDADATNASTDEEEQEEEEGKSKEEEEIALDDEDVDSVDEDAIPRRKVEIDNKVGPLSLLLAS